MTGNVSMNNEIIKNNQTSDVFNKYFYYRKNTTWMNLIVRHLHVSNTYNSRKQILYNWDTYISPVGKQFAKIIWNDQQIIVTHT